MSELEHVSQMFTPDAFTFDIWRCLDCECLVTQYHNCTEGLPESREAEDYIVGVEPPTNYKDRPVPR